MKKLLLILIVFAGCSKQQMDDCFTSLGKTTTVSRQLEKFNKISVSDRISLTIKQDTIKAGLIEVTAPANLIGQITSDVNENALSLENTNTCNFVRNFDYSINITAYVSDLVQLDIKSIATIKSVDTLYLDNLNIYHYALSNVDLLIDCNEIFVQSLNSASTILKGKSRVLKGSIEEISDLDARELLCEEVLLDSHTPLDCYLNATKGLFIKIYNTGNVYYLNEPTDYKELNVRRSSGNLLKL